MAVSLSDALLGLAGGAAEAYTTDVEKRRESDRRMIENANNLLTSSKVRMAETKFTQDLQKQQADALVRQQIQAAGGIESPLAQDIYATKVLGLSGKTKDNAILSGSVKIDPNYMKPPTGETLQAPGMDVFSTLNGSVTTKRGKERVASMQESFKNMQPSLTFEEKVGLPSQGTSPEIMAAYEDFLARQRMKDPTVEIDDGLVTEVLYNDDGTVQKVVRHGKQVQKAAKVDESRQMFIHPETGEVIRPTVDDAGQYYWGGQTIDITEYDPITDDSATESASRQVTRLETLNNRMSALGNVQAGIDSYKQTLTAATKGGATGVFIDIKGSVTNQIVGFAEMFGVKPITPEDREELFKQAGVDIDEMISANTGALRGMNKQMARQLVYSLAGILKEDADLARTSVSDVENAAAMIKDLTSGDTGMGAFRALQHTIDIKKAGTLQEIYGSRGASDEDRIEAGYNLFRLTQSRNPEEWAVIRKNIRGYSKSKKELMIAVAGATRDEPERIVTMSQFIQMFGEAGQLRPTLGVNPK